MSIFKLADIFARRYILGNDHRITTQQPADYVERDMRGTAKNDFIKAVEEICDTKNYKVIFLDCDSVNRLTKMRVTQLPDGAVCKGRFFTRSGKIFGFEIPPP